jgi:hypothetical protein
MPGNRRWTWTAGLLLGILGLLGAQHLARIEPPGGIWLKINLPGTREKPPVWFSHRRHEDRRLACVQCHHDYQAGQNTWHRGQPVQKCQACHGLKPQARRPDVKNAFHRQCKGCHLKLRQQRYQAGPINCLDCHRQG